MLTCVCQQLSEPAPSVGMVSSRDHLFTEEVPLLPLRTFSTLDLNTVPIMDQNANNSIRVDDRGIGSQFGQRSMPVEQVWQTGAVTLAFKKKLMP